MNPHAHREPLLEVKPTDRVLRGLVWHPSAVTNHLMNDGGVVGKLLLVGALGIGVGVLDGPIGPLGTEPAPPDAPTPGSRNAGAPEEPWVTLGAPVAPFEGAAPPLPDGAGPSPTKTCGAELPHATAVDTTSAPARM